jgi:hypothetical protein
MNTNQMVTIRIWVYDGIMASGIAGPIDVLVAANHLSAREEARRHTPSPIFAWRVESLDGQPVRSASGQSIAVDGKINPRKRADVILLTAPLFSNMDEFVGRRAQLPCWPPTAPAITCLPRRACSTAESPQHTGQKRLTSPGVIRMSNFEPGKF